MTPSQICRKEFIRPFVRRRARLPQAIRINIARLEPESENRPIYLAKWDRVVIVPRHCGVFSFTFSSEVTPMLRLAWTAMRRRRLSAPAPIVRLATPPQRQSSQPPSSSEPPSSSPPPSSSEPPRSISISNATPPGIVRTGRRHPGPSPARNHRGRILAMKIAHSRLCSKQRCERLERIGVTTLGDLAYGDLESVAANFNATSKALKQLQRYRRAIRLACSVPSLAPADAIALVSIHRPHPRSLATQTPAMLRRDLLRFADSTRGQSLLRGRPVPSIRRIKRWIAGAGEVVAAREVIAA